MSQDFVCERCDFVGPNKSSFERHIASKRHQNRMSASEEEFAQFHTCKKCTKKFKSRAGLWRHSQSCKHVENTVAFNTEVLNTLHEIKEQLATHSSALSVINNHTNNNTINNNHIHIYLNTHCNNAMNINQFVESMKVDMNVLEELNKHSFYHEGAIKILQTYFGQLTPEERPLHCAVPVVNKPISFFIREEDKWKEECLSMINYEMKYIEEFDNESDQLAFTRFLENFSDKLAEHYRKLRDGKPPPSPELQDTLQRIISKLTRGCRIEEKMKLVDLMVETNMLLLESSSSPHNETIGSLPI
jgi:hypothetical protein